MNLDIIRIEVIKIYDRRNKKLKNYNLVKIYDKEQLITKEEYDRIEEHNRVLHNQDLEFKKYLNNWN